MDPHPQAPSVVAVVVACDPGEWLEETLTALGAQDYPNLSLLVLDAGASGDDPTARIAQVLPDAYDIEAAQESLREVYEIADLIIPGHDNVFVNPRSAGM